MASRLPGSLVTATATSPGSRATPRGGGYGTASETIDSTGPDCGTGACRTGLLVRWFSGDSPWWADRGLRRGVAVALHQFGDAGHEAELLDALGRPQFAGPVELGA